MGRKHAGTGKCLYLCAAGLIALLFSACMTAEQRKTEQAGAERLVAGKRLLARNNFKGSMSEFREILSESRETPYWDEALFYMGIIYSHDKNPAKDYDKSIKFFMQLIEEHPQSHLALQADVMKGVLGENKKLRGRNEALKRKNEMLAEKLDNQVTANKNLLLGKKLLIEGNYEKALEEIGKVLNLPYNDPDTDEALFYSALIYADSDNPHKDYKRSREIFERLTKDYPRSPFAEQARIWSGILDVIEKAKQVDIEIEEKMKTMTR